MCGIAGIHFADRARVADAARARAHDAALAHRGPDGTGFHIEPGVGLGHARLSIIDLGGGAQPIHNEDRDGLDHLQRRGLQLHRAAPVPEQRGHRFYTHTDTEVIVHLYEELGDRFVEELNGQFAFALWDRNAAPPAAGARPRRHPAAVLRARPPDGVVFASEVKALSRAAWSARRSIPTASTSS